MISRHRFPDQTWRPGADRPYGQNPLHPAAPVLAQTLHEAGLTATPVHPWSAAHLTLAYRDGTLLMARMAQRGSPIDLAAVWARFERVQLQKSLDANTTVLQNRARFRL